MRNLEEAERLKLLAYNRCHRHSELNRSAVAPIKSMGFD
jgi:hypothetical protein